MFPPTSQSITPVSLCSQPIRLQPCKAILRDSVYETRLRDILADSFAIVVVGHSEYGYLQPPLLRKALATEINRIMLANRLLPDQIIVVAGGTTAGIGEVYPVARSMGIETLGILPAQKKNAMSPYCDRFITVENDDPADCATKFPQSGEEMLAAVLRITNSSVGLGGQLLAFNGDRQAYAATLAAARQGNAVSVIHDFDPVDAGQEQPFKMLAELECLQQAIAGTRGTCA